MRREVGMFKEMLPDFYGTLEPERHPEGTVVNLRVFSLEAEPLDDRTFVCRETTLIQFGPFDSDFLVEIQQETYSDATIYDNGYMFVAKDFTAVV